MKTTFALFAGLALAVTGFLSSCDNYTTTPTAPAAPVDTTTPWATTVSFSPAAGTYPSAQSVVITANDTTASIYYTVDNSIPTTASTAYKGAIQVNATTRIKAITVKGGVSSVVSPANYNISIPTIKPAGGNYTSAQSVTLSTTDPYAAIYYTTDGSVPTRSSTPYNGAIPVKTTTTINAVAVDNGVSSTVSTAMYTFPLLFAPAAGSFNSAQKVSLSTGNAGDTIYYTTDGTTPTSASTLYISGTGTIAVNATTTIKAIAVKGGKASAVFSGAYTINVVSFSKPAWVYGTPQTVTLSTLNSGDTIFYTTNGSTPTDTSIRYTGAFTVTATDTIKAVSINGKSSSPVYKAFYQIIPWQTMNYGSVTDSAGTSYKTVVIGSQTWMAENLNYAGTGTTPIGVCYKDSKDSCAKYGRLYTWSQAMNGASSTKSGKVQGICPTGWHIPTDTEWSTLLQTVDASGATSGSKLKNQTPGWKLNGTLDGNGSDAFGFRALPGGDTVGTAFNADGSAGFWWSATESDSTTAWIREIDYNLATVARYNYDKSAFGFSVRCTKD